MGLFAISGITHDDGYTSASIAVENSATGIELYMEQYSTLHQDFVCITRELTVSEAECLISFLQTAIEAQEWRSEQSA